MGEDALERVEAWAATLLAQLDDAGRRRLARDIARDLQRSQSRRIAEQRNPDGSPFAARKRHKTRLPIRSKSGRLKRRAKSRAQTAAGADAMFNKLRRPAHLKGRAMADGNGARVGFSSAAIARIARIHQEGLRDRVTRDSGSPLVSYPARRLLGFTDEERGRMADMILARLEV